MSGASAATLQLDLCNHWPPFVPDATAVYFREEPGRFLVHLEYAAASTPATGATCASSSTA